MINCMIKIFAVLTLFIAVSCVPIRTSVINPMPLDNLPDSVQVVANVRLKKFPSPRPENPERIGSLWSIQWFHIPANKRWEQQDMDGYLRSALPDSLANNYSGLQPVNIRAIGTPLNGLQTMWVLASTGLMLIPALVFNVQRVAIEADVIATERFVPQFAVHNITDMPQREFPREPVSGQRDLDAAISVAVARLTSVFPRGMPVAVVGVSSDGHENPASVAVKLESALSARSLAVRGSGNAQAGAIGSISDEAAVQAAVRANAGIAILCSTRQSGRSKSIILKALDVETGQIIIMAREQY